MINLSWKTRRRLSLLLLAVGMPIYIIVIVTVIGFLNRPPVLIELAIYIAAGILWVWPTRFIFRGIGTADPDSRESGSNRRDA